MAGSGSDRAHSPALIPDHLLLPVGEPLRAWRAVVCSPSMPTVDVEAALSQVVASVGLASNVVANIPELAHWMAYGEGLYERELLQQWQKRAIFDATFYFAVALAEQLLEIKAYLNGLFPYELQGVLPDDTLVLRNVRPAEPEKPRAADLGHA